MAGVHLDGEIHYQPSLLERAVAQIIQSKVQPAPQVEFIAQPLYSAGPPTMRVFRFTVGPQAKECDMGSDLVMQCALSDNYTAIVASLALETGATVNPIIPAVVPVVIPPDTSIPTKKDGYVLGPFGWSKIPNS